ncbi:helix-turn-helix domain-containing protein [Sphingomonas sp. ID0503]|uniref:helix-turn-helix domain-containing protein n=1 Tax=Sphingomonas sp. ID0503 TaxID=3399691 RepID=UPI003AFABDB2
MNSDQPGGVGARLREARIARDLSLEQVAEQTRIPLRHLKAIESGDFANIPAAPYAVGFVKSYARVIGLDPQETGAAFRAEMAGADVARPAAIAAAPADPTRIPPKWLAVTALIIAVLLIGGYGLWRGYDIGGADPDAAMRTAAGLNPPDPAGAPTPVDRPSAPVVAPAAPVAVARNVALTPAEPVWVKITDGATTLFMGTLAAGQRYDVPPTAADPMIRTGRPNVLNVTVGTQAIPALGPPERLVKDVSLKADALLARAAAPVTPAAPAAPTP